MSIKTRFQMLFNKKKVNQKPKLVIYRTDWSKFFSGKEMI